MELLNSYFDIRGSHGCNVDVFLQGCNVFSIFSHENRLISRYQCFGVIYYRLLQGWRTQIAVQMYFCCVCVGLTIHLLTTTFLCRNLHGGEWQNNCEYLTAEDVKGSGYGLLQGTTPDITWRDWIKRWMSMKVAESRNCKLQISPLQWNPKWVSIISFQISSRYTRLGPR